MVQGHSHESIFNQLPLGVQLNNLTFKHINYSCRIKMLQYQDQYLVHTVSQTQRSTLVHNSDEWWWPGDSPATMLTVSWSVSPVYHGCIRSPLQSIIDSWSRCTAVDSDVVTSQLLRLWQSYYWLRHSRGCRRFVVHISHTTDNVVPWPLLQWSSTGVNRWSEAAAALIDHHHVMTPLLRFNTR